MRNIYSTIVKAGVSLLVVISLIMGLGSMGIPHLPKIPCVASCTTIRSSDVLLKSVQNQSKYVSVKGNYQVVVTLEKDMFKFIPFWDDQLVIFLGQGSVDVFSDFSKMKKDDIKVDGDTVTISVPAPQYDAADLDLEKSKILFKGKGTLVKVKDFFAEDNNEAKKLYLQTVSEFDKTAKQSDLLEQGKKNTEAFFTNLFMGAGFKTVHVNFFDPNRGV